jgi:hypothetical protein
VKNQFFADKRDLFKYDLWLEIANALQIRKHTFIPMLTPNDSTKQGGVFPGDAGNYRHSLFEFLKRCRKSRNIKQLRAFFRGQSLEYHPYRDTERGYFRHESRDEYFAGIPRDWLKNSAILIDPDVGLETTGPSWKKRPEQHVMCKEVAEIARAARGKTVILLFQFLQPNAKKREADLREREQRLRGELEAVRCGWRPILWVAERQKSRDGRALPRELAFFIIAVGKKTEEAVETVVRDYARSRGSLCSLGCGEVLMDYRYPTGKFQWEDGLSEEQRRSMIEQIAEMPGKVRAAVAGLNEQQLDTPYREGGWTVRQVIHHLADSHLNAFVRFKLALTEDVPTVKTYEQQLWAELVDARTAPVEPSLAMLEGLHQRWVIMLRQMSAADFARQFQHPELGVMKLERLLGMYAWHGRHHVAHLTSLRERMRW